VILPARINSVTEPPAGSGGGSGANDPRYSTCTAAKAAGYGPYRRGVDPEYAWYTDRDNDGIACE
jgi:micrococcal nuclease